MLTGSINQYTVEAGTSDGAKDMLQELNIQDTDYALAGDIVRSTRLALPFTHKSNGKWKMENGK